ncbi:hypothetical protein [Azospirillum sp. B2RO_4]|uniref:hypothetical protein n=1 Tax=Azospirillum sp. B2RO_4 TaxID=3027796 RepID=UPI003DA7D0C9
MTTRTVRAKLRDLEARAASLRTLQDDVATIIRPWLRTIGGEALDTLRVIADRMATLKPGARTLNAEEEAALADMVRRNP